MAFVDLAMFSHWSGTIKLFQEIPGSSVDMCSRKWSLAFPGDIDFGLRRLLNLRLKLSTLNRFLQFKISRQIQSTCIELHSTDQSKSQQLELSRTFIS